MSCHGFLLVGHKEFGSLLITNSTSAVDIKGDCYLSHEGVWLYTRARFAETGDKLNVRLIQVIMQN
jgi:hypothetical protein